MMFKDPGLKKLIPSNMEIETYTAEVVKIIGMCYFYLVHPDSKQLMKVMFFVAKDNSRVLLSCRTTMELGLIKPHVRLNYLLPKARLLTSTCDQPSKIKIYKPTIHCTKETAKPIKRVVVLTVDKGVAMVIMDQQDYNNKAQALLQDNNTYKVLPKDPTPNSKTNLSPYSKASNKQEASAPKNINNYIPPVQSHPNFMAYPKYIKLEPPQTHSIQ